jgi:hypothetical protein
MTEASAHNVTDVMKQRTGRQLNQVPDSFQVGNLKPGL